jgi:hypothetical protein
MAPEEAVRGIFIANPLHKTDTTLIVNPSNLDRVDINLVEGAS